MTTSAQIRRNQQNAKHSTGPRTIEGKSRSKYNAVKHACTAKLVLLPAEQPTEFNKRTIAFFEHFMPQNPYEVVLTEDAVYCSWQLQRCREAAWSRMHQKAVMGDADELQRLENEVTELSGELFRAPNGRPTALPQSELPDAEAGKASKGKYVAAGDERPGRVLRGLESNEFGVSWLLIEWNALLAPIERGEGWNASERFRATRLLGIHPMDAYLNDDLTSMLQACQTLDPTAGCLVSEVWNGVVSANDLPALENQYQRLVEQRPTMDRDAAREHLIGMVRLEVERLEGKAREHQMRAELKAELGHDLAKFDLSHEGLLMLRYEFAWRRLMDRKTKELEKLNEERSKKGWGRSNTYLRPSAGWLQTDDHDLQDDDHDHEQDVCAGLNGGDEATAGVDTDEQSPAVVPRRHEAAGLGLAVLRNEPKDVNHATGGTTDDTGGSLRNEPKDVSRAVEGTTDDAGGSLRNEPKDVNGAIEGTTEDARGSFRNEPTVVSEAVAVGRGDGDDKDELVRNERGVVRSVRFDKGVIGAMRDSQQLLRPGIGLRDAVRLGNRDGGDGGGSRRERRLRKKEEARAGAR